MTAQQTLDGRRRSLKGNVEVLKVRSPGQHDAEEMKGRTRARRSIGGLIGIASAPGNEISSVFTVLGTSGPIAISMDVVEMVEPGRSPAADCN